MRTKLQHSCHPVGCAPRTIAPHSKQQSGYTLIELLIALALSAILFTGLGSVVGQAIDSRNAVHETNALTRQARFAMEQMVRATSHSHFLLLPFNDKPWSSWQENVREETVPPTIPTDGSIKYTAVLAVTLPHHIDLDGDGFPDADDDRDGRIDEDFESNRTYSVAPGIYLIDDDADGWVDEGSAASDDESTSVNDDPINGVDDDDDNNVDEDPPSDMNADGCPGSCGVDDDGDGQVDEGAVDDDDEDGQSDEDWFNAVVFYLDNGTLMQRTPVPWDESGVGGITGRDFIVEPIAENITRFRVERVPQNGDRSQIVDLTLELTNPVTGETVNLNTRVRVGGAL